MRNVRAHRRGCECRQTALYVVRLALVRSVQELQGQREKEMERGEGGLVNL